MKAVKLILVYVGLVLLIGGCTSIGAEATRNEKYLGYEQELVIDAGSLVTVDFLDQNISSEIELTAESGQVFVFQVNGLANYDSDRGHEGQEAFSRKFTVHAGDQIILSNAGGVVSLTIKAQRPVQINLVRKFGSSLSLSGAILVLGSALQIILLFLYWGVVLDEYVRSL